MPEFITGPPFTVTATTGLKRRRFVTVNSAGKLAYPVNGATVAGVLFADSSTGSTEEEGRAVQAYGIAEVEATGSTLAAGALVKSSSVGLVTAWTTGSIGVGQIVYGTSGTTGRVVSVLLKSFGHSTAI